MSQGPSPKVAILMGSDSDLPVMAEAARALESLGVPYEIEVTSAHRTPERTAEIVRGAPARGVKVFVVGAGSATLTATFGGLTATRTIAILGAIQSITVSPATLLLTSGTTRPMTATAHLADGRTADVTTLATWRCDPIIGSLYEGSNFWSSGPGSGTLTAAIGDVFGAATATVVRDPVQFGGLVIRPNAPLAGDRLPIGHTGKLRAAYVYSVGGWNVEVPVQGEVTWTSDTPSVAAFDDPAQPGRIHALAAGTVYARAAATSPSGAPMQASMPLTIVTPTAPFALAPATIPLGGAAQLRVAVPVGTSTAYATAFATFESSDPSRWPTPRQRA